MKPTKVLGTNRYADAAKNMTQLHRKIHEKADFNDYMPEEDFPGRLDDFARTIHEDNIFEQMGYLYLIHDDADNLCFKDMLAFHADWGTDPAWNFLTCGWKTFFVKSLGRHVTGTMTASHKKSVPDYYGRRDVIGSIADMIITNYRRLPNYRQDVTEETLFPAEGDAHLESDTPHYIIDSHSDPFLHLGNIIHTVHRLRKFLLDELKVKMSVYLMYEMVYSGIDESNNILRYAKFADLHFDGWKLGRRDPLPPGSSFLDCYQLFLRDNYSANDGKAGMNGGADEGVVRHRPSNNTPRMVATCHSNVRALFEIVGQFSRKKVCESSFTALMSSLNKDTHGTGELRLQKMIYAVACCDDRLSTEWIRYCKPGSDEHRKRLKERKYRIESNAQVGQIVKIIAKKLQIPAPKAEHLLCMTLSPTDSKDPVILDYNLFYCALDDNGEISIRYINGENGDDERIRTGGFQFGASAAYYPAWAQPHCLLEAYGLRARYPNAANLIFNVAKKSSVAQRRTLNDEKMVSCEEVITVADIQTLMTKNKTLAITDPMEFVATAFQVTRSQLKEAITVHRSGTGYFALIDRSVLDDVNLVRRVRQISDVREARRPVYKLKDRRPVYDLESGLSRQNWLYDSQNDAVVSLLLHLLMNVQFRDGTSWTFKYLKNTKEVIILVPFSRCGGTMEVVATIYREGNQRGTKIYSRFFESGGNAGPSMVIGRDNIGVFDGSLLG
jgi:hypothetical protein